MALFVVLLVAGQAVADRAGEPGWAAVLLAAAILVRCAAVPASCWLTDWFAAAPFGTAILFVTPLVWLLPAVRLVLPIAPEWVLQAATVVAVVTAVAAAGMATVQAEVHRFFAHVFLSQTSLVFIGVAQHTPGSLTGALALWPAVSLTFTGLGLTLGALEARFGRVSLARYHGLYHVSPTLAVCFVLTGLAGVGFPISLGYGATRLILEGTAGTALGIAVAVVGVLALNGIAVMRAYFRLFAAAGHISHIHTHMPRRERFAVLVLTALILSLGLVPQPVIASRHRAAVAAIAARLQHVGGEGQAQSP